MATDKDTTFQDILLELMVANETLDKIEKNTASLLPFLSDTTATQNGAALMQMPSTPDSADPVKVDVVHPDPVDVKVITADPVKVDVVHPDPVDVKVITPDPVKVDVVSEAEKEGPGSKSEVVTCCDEILKCAVDMKHSLELLAHEAIFSGGVLIQIRNSLSGIHSDIVEGRRAAELGRLQSAENAREAGAARAPRSGTVVTRPSASSRPASGGIGIVDSIPKLGGAALAALTAFPVGVVSGFMDAFRKSLNDSFSGKVLEQATAGFKKVKGKITEVGTKIGESFTGIREAFAERFDRLQSRTKAFLRKTGIDTKAAELATKAEEVFNATKSKMLEGLKPLTDGLKEIKAGLSEGAQKIVSTTRGFVTELSETKAMTTLADAAKSVKGSLAELGTEVKSVAKTLAEGPAEVKAGLGEGFSKISARVSETATELKTIYTGVAKEFAEGAKEIKAGLGEGLMNIGKTARELTTAVKESSFGRFIGEIKESFSSIGRALEELGGYFTGPKGIGTRLYDAVIKPFGDFFRAFDELFPVFSKLGKAVGELLGKLAIPVTIIFGILDFFKGFNEEQGDLTAKFKAGMIELVNGLVGWLVDIPKSIISWIAGALGFSEFEKELDKMNFKDSILKPVMEFGEKLFTHLFEWLGSMTKTIVKAVLPKSVQKLLGMDEGPESTGPESRKAAGKYRDQNVLDGAAKMLADPKIRQERKDDLVANLQANYGFSAKEIADAAAKAGAETTSSRENRIVSPQAEAASANNTGAVMTAYQTQTNDLNAEAAAAPAIVAPSGNAAPVVNNANVNSVVVNSTNQPDRTQNYMVPAFGY